MIDKMTDKKLIAICTALPSVNVNVQYMASVTDLISLLKKEGYDPHTISAIDSYSISRAKNSLIAVALKQPNLHGVLFIDPDLAFDPQDVVNMITSNKNVIAAAVPSKSINWKQIRSAALMGRENLELYSGGFSVEFFADGNIDFSLDSPLKVKSVSSNLMYISKDALEKLKPACNQYSDVIDSSDKFEEVSEYFYASKNSEKVLTSEDFNFCGTCRKLDEDIWVAPWVKVQSSGSYTFLGNFFHSLELSSRVAEVTKANKD